MDENKAFLHFYQRCGFGAGSPWSRTVKNSAVEAKNGARKARPGGSQWMRGWSQWMRAGSEGQTSKIHITFMRIRIRIKVKKRISIRIKVKSVAA
jgi:hypothetical protein